MSNIVSLARYSARPDAGVMDELLRAAVDMEQQPISGYVMVTMERNGQPGTMSRYVSTDPRDLLVMIASLDHAKRELQELLELS